MTDGREPRPFRVPPEAIVERGSSIEREGGVLAAVYHVQGDGERRVVYEERTPNGDVDLACSCPARRGCEHVAAVIIHLARRVPLPATAGSQADQTSRPERTSWPSDPSISSSFTLPPPAALPEPDAESLEADRPRARRILDVIKAILETLSRQGLVEGQAILAGHVATLEKELRGVAAPDLVRPCSELRTVIASREADPAHVAMLMERLRGVVRVLGALVDGDGPGLKLEGSFLGKRWAFEETKRGEDALLLEVARSTVLTPFGLRRNKAYFLDLVTGRMHVEQSHERPGDARNPSVGPFPRRIHAGLMMIMPGIPPTPVRLLQYVVLPPPGESDLLKIKNAALGSAGEAFHQLRRIVKMVQAPYPAFVAFSPARVLTSAGRAALADGEGGILKLAHRVDPYACRSLARLAGRDRVHCVMGTMVWTGHEVALNPLSVLVEHQRGMSLLRMR